MAYPAFMTADSINIRWLGLKDYVSCWEAMRSFTHARDEHTLDECWLLEHPPVFTQGQNGKAEHLLYPGEIPVIQTDRGGQITYHGPGQLMVYTLIDLKRKQLAVRHFVTQLEQAVIDLLASYHLAGFAKRDAPGVYVDSKKICSIGLRIRKGCSYHGIALNVATALENFNRIHPCGFPELKMTQLADLGGPQSTLETGRDLVNYLMKNLEYTTANLMLK